MTRIEQRIQQDGGTIVGTDAAMRALDRRDPRVWLSLPQPAPGGPVVRVRLGQNADLRPAARPGPGVLAAVAAGAAVGVVMVGVLAVTAAVAVAARWQLLVGVGAALMFLLYVTGVAVTRCPGLHCAGCGHR